MRKVRGRRKVRRPLFISRLKPEKIKFTCQPQESTTDSDN